MKKVFVALADQAEQEKVATELRLKQYEVNVGDVLRHDEDFKEAARRLSTCRADVVILDYLTEDAYSVKVLQEVTDRGPSPRVIFILPEGIDTSHVVMAVNEGASALLQSPVNCEALANYVDRAICGPGRFRHEAAMDASMAEELARTESEAKAIKMQMASFRKLVSFLMSTPVSSQHRSVLLVSDSAYQRDHLRRLFEDHGFLVNTAHNPDEGLEKALAEKPRIVISDLEMEGKNGIEFCHDLKINHKFMPCFFVICTANAEKLDSVMAPGNGVDACVIKPTNENESTALVASAAMGLLL